MMTGAVSSACSEEELKAVQTARKNIAGRDDQQEKEKDMPHFLFPPLRDALIPPR
jgi:hypothetical protein